MFFIDKPILDELVFHYVNAMTDTNYFQAKHLGTLVHHMLNDMYNAEYKQPYHKALNSLFDLMTTPESKINTLDTMMHFGLNHFSVFLQYHGLLNIERSCLEHEVWKMQKYKKNQVSDSMYNHLERYIKPSPCSKPNVDVKCKKYCNWFTNVTKALDKHDILTIMR